MFFIGFLMGLAVGAWVTLAVVFVAGCLVVYLLFWFRPRPAKALREAEEIIGRMQI